MEEFYLIHVFTALLYVQCTAGIILNGFIVVTNIKNWRTQKTLQICDKILSCLATSRCLLLSYIMFINFLFMFSHQLILNPVILSSIFVGIILLNHTNLWFTTILCVFYCVKITNYTHYCFTYLKTRISSLVHWIILASLPIFVACSLPCGWFAYYLEQQEFTSGLAENKTFTNVVVDNTTNVVVHEDKQYRFLMFLVGSLPPFLIFCVAISLLIHSLWLHIRHMRCGGTGFRSPNLEVHFCAVKSMSLFLVLHILYFVFMIIQLSPTFNVSNTWKVFGTLITCYPPFLHSIYIIFSTKKLKETFVKWFCCL